MRELNVSKNIRYIQEIVEKMLAIKVKPANAITLLLKSSKDLKRAERSKLLLETMKENDETDMYTKDINLETKIPYSVYGSLAVYQPFKDSIKIYTVSHYKNDTVIFYGNLNRLRKAEVLKDD